MPKYALGTNAQGQGMGSIVPGAITSTVLAPQTPIQLPPQQPLNNGQNTNISVPNPPPSGWDAGTYANFKAANPGLEPTPEDTAKMQAAGGQNKQQSASDIINNNAAPTAAEQTQSDLGTQIADIMGGNTSLATRQTQAETTAGVPALTKTVSDLSTQLQGLNDQATKLQLDAQPGGTIDNAAQLSAAGLGRTTGGQAPLTAAELRKNQIQQNGIAAQALTLKSAYYAANNNLTLAKDSADKAAQVAFDAVQQELNHKKAQLDAIAPQLSRDQQTRSLLQQAQLADRQTQINYQREDYKSGQALAIAAMKLNPNDANAQYAAQQAMKLDPHSPDYIQQVMSLVGKYQSDPLATQQAILNLQKTRYEIAAIAPISPNDPNAKAALDPDSQSILAQTGLSVAAFNFLTTGTSALSRLSGNDRKLIQKEAGDFLNKNGLDYSTFQSQYKAQNDVIQKNIARAANTKIFGGEVSGTVDQFIADVGADLPNLKPAAITDLLVRGQTNDPLAQKYAFDLRTMQNDLAGYYAASRGATSPDLQDTLDAANVISSGLSSKGAAAFKQAIDANEQKVTGVVSRSVDAANQSIWGLFGVGEKYKTKTSSSDSNSHVYNGVTYKLVNGTWTPQK